MSSFADLATANKVYLPIGNKLQVGRTYEVIDMGTSTQHGTKPGVTVAGELSQRFQLLLAVRVDSHVERGATAPLLQSIAATQFTNYNKMASSYRFNYHKYSYYRYQPKNLPRILI